MTFPLMVLIKTFDWSSFCSQMPNTVLNRLSVSADVLTLFSLYGAVFGSKCLLLLLLLCKYGPCCIWSLLSESIFVHQTILNHKICAVDARIVRTCLSRPAGLSPAGPLHLLAASLPTILCVPADLPGHAPPVLVMLWERILVHTTALWGLCRLSPLKWRAETQQ